MMSSGLTQRKRNPNSDALGEDFAHSTNSSTPDSLTNNTDINNDINNGKSAGNIDHGVDDDFEDNDNDGKGKRDINKLTLLDEVLLLGLKDAQVRPLIIYLF